MSADDKLISELKHDGQVLHLLLDAPKGNVLDTEMMTGIEAALAAHGDDKRLKAIVFEGTGNHFSFGASVPEHTKERVGDMLPKFHGMFRRLMELAIPTVAVVRGQCLGGGLELAAYCTWIFAENTAVFGQPEIKLAVFAPMASTVLPWRLGAGRAMDLCISGRSIGAEEAKAMGLVHSIAVDATAACDALIQEELLTKSGTSLRFAERAARRTLAKAFEEDLPWMEKLYLDELMTTHDANEGITAFLERREPKYE